VEAAKRTFFAIVGLFSDSSFYAKKRASSTAANKQAWSFPATFLLCLCFQHASAGHQHSTHTLLQCQQGSHNKNLKDVHQYEV